MTHSPWGPCGREVSEAVVGLTEKVRASRTGGAPTDVAEFVAMGKGHRL